jgi:purine-nucleoside phosphorylase
MMPNINTAHMQEYNAEAARRLPRRLHEQLQRHYAQSVAAIDRFFGTRVDGIVVAGSGMQSLFQTETLATVPYSELEGFPAPTVAGHAGEVRLLRFAESTVLLFAGRSHLYEGRPVQDIIAPLAAAYLLNARYALLLNSAGGLHPDFRTADIMVIADTVSMTFRSIRRSWLYATPRSYRHPASYFDTAWRERTAARLVSRGVPFREGTYVGVTGPTYETPAEVRMYRRCGAHAIGMSTVHEAEFAHFCGLQVAGCSLISNTLHEVAAPALSHDDVLLAASSASAKVEAWIRAACESAETKE